MLPLLVGYAAHIFFQRRLQPQRSLGYCVLLSAALFSLGDAVHLIQVYFVADPDAMTSAHLAVTHFCLAFFVLSNTEYHSRTECNMPYPDVYVPPPANNIASFHPKTVVRWQVRGGREPSATIFWRTAALDFTILALWYVAMWRFMSVLQAWLNPDFEPKAGIAYRPFPTALGFEIVWTSKGLDGAILQAVLMRPVRILNGYVFAYTADGVLWLRRSLYWRAFSR